MGERGVTEKRMTRLVNLATVAGAAITAASMIFGVMTYRRGVQVQHEASAIGILQEFLKLSIEHPQLASGAAEQAEDPQYVWFTTHALFTAETLWSLKGRDRQWKALSCSSCARTDITWSGARFHVTRTSRGFVEFMKSEFPTLKCSQ